MKKMLLQFLEIVSKNTKYCPWFKVVNSDELLNEFLGEINEFRNYSDKKNAEEELGDILWDFFMLIEKLDIENKIDKKNVFLEINDKINRRKPYIFENKTVSLDEASQIWFDAKKNEKGLKTPKNLKITTDNND